MDTTEQTDPKEGQQLGQTAAPGQTAPLPAHASPSLHGVLGEVDVRGKANNRSNSDVRLAMRAAREKWPLAEDKRAWCVERLLEGAEHAPEWRERIAAIRVLVGMEAQNMQAKGEGQQQTGTINQTLIQIINQAGRDADPKPLPVDSPPALPPTQQG
jgi:hypothetical protein